MSYRRFTDRNGRSWEVRDRYRDEWEFAPDGENTLDPVKVNPPGYENDPFEMSQDELQRLLDSAPPQRGSKKPSPFLDTDSDDPTSSKSPFID